MKIFIWETVPNCGSGSYHESGGIVVVASTLDRAVEIAVTNGCKFKDKHSDALQDHVSYDLVDDATEEKFFRMPDAGCC